MFCFQCQETLNNSGCTAHGVCGKDAETAALQDMLVFAAKGISYWAQKGRSLEVSDPAVDLAVIRALFTTVTNVNFDPDAIAKKIESAFALRDALRSRVIDAHRRKTGASFNLPIPDPASWTWQDDRQALLGKATSSGVLACEDEDIRSLRELVVYGVKGIAAYADHAYVLKHSDSDLYRFIHDALAATLDDTLSADDLVGWVLKTGEYAVRVMALLDEANTSAFGHPEPTQISTGTEPGPAILVSGHDLQDLYELLRQTEGKGVNIYTHGEMLPALAYPKLKQFSHLKGNYGTSWYNQQKEFEAFNGAILMTTNCLQKPRSSYRDRLFTTGLVGWPDITHIADRGANGEKDLNPVIAKALSLAPGLEKTEGKTLTIGFAHEAILSHADAILAAVNSGKLKRFVVMGGCDGHQKSRNYFTEVAEQLPADTAILTAGCAKYRYNMLDLGSIDGIPRVIDAGQCNDSYSLAVTALKLKEILGVDDINDLPISYDIAWYEQKAVTVLLALLYLGVKGIRLGPTLPAFLSPNVVKVLVEKFAIRPIETPETDVAAMMAGN
ncbi:hydroxylamine reductase [candidate division KSB1 bacterium]|nr:hydroxylamine reductase [candidate division KSB1 bacterium]